MATKTRSDLKSYFVKNAIPTEGNFADLIDSQLNQAQDGVFKPDNDALTVVAATGDQKRVLRLYASYPAANPDWMISLNPAQDPAKAAATSKPGFGITDGTGKIRLFVDAATGQIGVGTNTPQVAVDVTGTVQANGFRGRYDLVLSDYRTVNPSSNVCLQSPGNDRDAWIYRDSAVGSASSNYGIYHRQIDSAVGNLPGNSIGFVGNTTLQAYIALGDGSAYFAGKVGIGTTSPDASLHVTNGSRFSGGQHFFTDVEKSGRLRVGSAWSIPGLYSEDNQDIVVGCGSGKTVHLGFADSKWDSHVTATEGALRAPGGLTFDGGVAHIDRDGALYRNTDGQVYLTVDDNFYIRDSGSGTNWAAYFNTNSGDLTVKGNVNAQGMSTKTLSVDAKVGIGTTAPEAGLHVTNGSRFSGDRHLFTDSEGTNRLRVGTAWKVPGVYSEDAADIVIGCRTGQKVHLGQIDKVTVQDGNLTASGNVNAQAMSAKTLSVDAKVGIGTNAPEASLHVTNGSRFSGDRHYFTDSEAKSRVRVGACAGIAGIYAEDTQDIYVGCDPSKTLHLYQPNTVTVKGGNLSAPGGQLGSIGIGKGDWHGKVDSPYETLQLDPTHNLRIWFGTTQRAVLENSGQFTIYLGKGYWRFQNDGNLVKYRNDGTPLWALSSNPGW